ncbi:MAG TPA: LytTR family DNA-binding domain-containing protein [Flavitalea sp.]|nr:LytTR family DNA-binding domain-containing protein [Flavitalea sp.]
MITVWIDFFNTSDIIYCKAEGSYTTLVLKDKQNCLVSKNLKDFENLLAESGFCRVHHSYLINLSHVQKYIKGEGGYVLLTEGHHVDISRRKKDEFLSLLDKL